MGAALLAGVDPAEGFGESPRRQAALGRSGTHPVPEQAGKIGHPGGLGDVPAQGRHLSVEGVGHVDEGVGVRAAMMKTSSTTWASNPSSASSGKAKGLRESG